MLARNLERVTASASRRTVYTCLGLGLLGIVLGLKVRWFNQWDRGIIDFDLFHLVAQRFWTGDVEPFYDFPSLLEILMNARGGKPTFMPWTYPPQFNLVVAPLSFLSIGAAYFLFMLVTLTFYLAILKRVAGIHFPLLLLLTLPTLLTTLGLGQNGFLTGGLIGVACLTIEKRPALAGLSLGLLVIKPHLAIAFAFYSVLARRWITVLIAIIVILGSSILCTLIFEATIWKAFLRSLLASGIFLEHGYYPLYRMTSIYATLRSIGCSSWIAFGAQTAIAALALFAVAVSIYKQLPTRLSVGITAIASVLISPYAYDYDLPIFGIGLALIVPDLMCLGSERERTMIYGLVVLTGFYSLLQSARLTLQYGGEGLDLTDKLLPSIGGAALATASILVFWILLRSSNPTSRSLASNKHVDASRSQAGHVIQRDLGSGPRSRPAS